MDQNKQQHEDEPKIFGVYIDDQHHKTFDRRQFIKSATIVGATVALTGCDFGSDSFSEEEMAEALEKTLQAREKEEGAQEEIEEPISDDSAAPTDTPTKIPTNTPTKKPTNTATKKPTNTATKIPTETEIPFARGEVTFSHSIFKGPHVNHPFLAKTVVGEEVTILGRTSNGVWYKITDSEGTTGWVFSEFITLTNNVRIPTIYDLPTQVPDPCDCDNYVAPTSCGCDSHTDCSCVGDSCTCDYIHYWYPD